MFHFNTNKPQSFFSFFFFLQNTSCVRKPQVISVILSEYLAYERLHRPETWRRFLYIYLLSFSSFWTLCIAWSVVISILECVTKWKPATECRMCIVTQESKGLRSWSCVEMCIIFKEGWKLLAVKQVPHPSATFSLTSYPKPSKTKSSIYIQIILSCVVTVKEHLKNPWTWLYYIVCLLYGYNSTSALIGCFLVMTGD